MAEISGVLTKIKYMNTESGFTIAQIKLSKDIELEMGTDGELFSLEAGRQITAKGKLGGIKEGVKGEFHGYFTSDNKWGLQFNVVRVNLDEESRSLEVDMAVKSFLSRSVADGNTYETEERLLDFLMAELSADEEEAINSFNRLTMDGEVMADQSIGVPVIYQNSMFEAETRVCGNLYRLSEADVDGLEEGEEIDFSPIEKKMNVILSESQKEAIFGAVSNGVSVITGGPGTGKTTIIRAIYRFLRDMGHLVAIAAPTGRAAKRIKDSTGYNAVTIHRLLEATVDEKTEKTYFRRNENEPLEYDAVIIDEASMIDLKLMDRLLLAMPTGTRLVLVGDCDQLPPVGAGNVLRDILESGYIHSVILRDIFRQAKESKIIVTAHEINRGEIPILENKDDDDLIFVNENLGQKALEDIIEAAKAVGTQVIAPSKRGILGIEKLNQELQSALNPKAEWKNEIPFNDGILREGDRVMQIKNNYMREWKIGLTGKEGSGLFNGDMGRVIDINLIKETVKIDFEDKISTYTYGDLKEISHSFAITVHKSQGSEFDNVVMPVNMVGPLLGTRNMLYTAITRAKKSVRLVGSHKALHYMIENNTNRDRNSGLKVRLMKLMEDDCQIY